MVAVRGPGDEWREGRVLLPERRSGGDENRRGEWREGRVLLPERRSGGDENRRCNGARAGFCCRSGAGLASCRSYARFGCRARTI